MKQLIEAMGRYAEHPDDYDVNPDGLIAEVNKLRAKMEKEFKKVNDKLVKIRPEIRVLAALANEAEELGVLSEDANDELQEVLKRYKSFFAEQKEEIDYYIDAVYLDP